MLLEVRKQHITIKSSKTNQKRAAEKKSQEASDNI